MSGQPLLHDLDDVEYPLVGMKYCRKCWREEAHRMLIPRTGLTRTFLEKVTLGWLEKYEPSQCVCCRTCRLG
jgi:hypothetical protein